MVQLSNFEIINPKNKQIIQLHSYVYWYKQIDNDNLKKKKKNAEFVSIKLSCVSKKCLELVAFASEFFKTTNTFQ